jgi:hypothetical protein
LRITPKLIKLLATAFLFSAMAAADTLWTLDDVTFEYTTIFGQELNNQASGSFTIGPGLVIDNWNITVTGYQPADGTYNSSDSLAMVLDNGTYLLFTNFQGFTLLGLDLASALNSGKTTIDLVPGSIWQLDPTAACGAGIPPCTFYNSGSIVDGPVPSPTPEPSSIALSVPAVLGAAMVLRRRKLFAKVN